jgi:hypothetical protein
MDTEDPENDLVFLSIVSDEPANLPCNHLFETTAGFFPQVFAVAHKLLFIANHFFMAPEMGHTDI